MVLFSFEFGKIQKFSRLAEYASESNNKHTVSKLYFLVKNQEPIIHFNVILKTCIVVS